MLFIILKLILLTVLAKEGLAQVKEKNIALGKPAFQSSVVDQGVSSNAVDGYRHPDFSERSCILTVNQREPWWVVDLQDDFYVTSVVITNRRDCCHERLSGFEIKVGDNNIGGGVINAKCAPVFYRPLDPGESLEIVCDEPLKGRYVSVIIPTVYGVLNFCELEVYGRKASSVARLKLISNGVVETHPDQNLPSQIIDNDKTYSFQSLGIHLKLFDIKTGETINQTAGGFLIYNAEHDRCISIENGSLHAQSCDSKLTNQIWRWTQFDQLQSVFNQYCLSSVDAPVNLTRVHLFPCDPFNQSCLSLPDASANWTRVQLSTCDPNDKRQVWACADDFLRLNGTMLNLGYESQSQGGDNVLLYQGTGNWSKWKVSGDDTRVCEKRDGASDGLHFDTWNDVESQKRMKKFLGIVNPGTVVGLVLFYSGEKYYQDSVPYLEELLGQPITADLEYGESWALLGYKGFPSPVPHWRESVRRKRGKGPSKITKLVTLRKAPSGPPSNVKTVFTNGSSVKLTWSRPHDYLTDDEYPFNYSLCINHGSNTTCDQAKIGYQYTFAGLQSLTNYLISIRAQSADMFGEAVNLNTFTTETDASRINVRLVSRLQEDVLYRAYGKPYSSIAVSGVAHNFDQYGHHFIILDAKTGIVIQHNSFDTYESPNSGSKMAAFLSSLPDKVIILMVVYHRAHVYYNDAAASLIAVCPHAPSTLNQDESNALICLKGLGTAAWMKSKISSYSLGPAVLEANILLPKDLFTFPTITRISSSATSLAVEWRAPTTDKFTGDISKYELCYSGDFDVDACIEIGADDLRWNVTELHPHVHYGLKIRSAALLGYGPFSVVQYATTLEAAPSGPPTNLRVVFVNSTSIIAAWSAPEVLLQNGIIQHYNVCVRSFKINGRCENEVVPGNQKFYIASGLEPYTVYDVIISAATSVGYGPSMLVINKTLEAAPSGPPINLRIIFVDPTSMTVAWSAPEEELRNGVIQNYKICVRSFKITDQCEDKILPGSQKNHTASGLVPFTLYDVIVSAATSVGYGPSMLIINRTTEAAPSSSPLSFTVSSVSSTQFNLTWSKPRAEHHNGILTKYRIILMPEPWSLTSDMTIVLPSDHVNYLATDLRPYVNYIIEIRVGNAAGFGPAAVLNVRTLMEAPSGPPTFVQIKNVTSTTFQVAWSLPSKEKRNGVIVSYFLCIREFGVLFACNNTRIVSGTQSQQLFTGLNSDREYLVEIKAATKIGYGPSAFVQKMAGKCDNALLSGRNKIENFQFSASGYLSDGHEAFQARFSNLQIWCEDGVKRDASLQVDIGGLIRIIAVATQGDISHFNAWVTSYNVMYSKNGIIWTTATVSGKEKIQGNTGGKIVKHYLDEPVLTRYIRFEVSSFSGPHPCMRIELYGCAPAVSPDSISILSSNATSLEVAWQPSKVADTNGDIQGYVICPRDTSLVTCQMNKTYSDQNERTRWIVGLEPYTEYAVEISSYNVAGEGSFISAVQRTEQAAPSSGPESIDILGTTTTSIRLYWTPVSEKTRNGIISTYSLCYQEYELEHPCWSFQNISSDSRNFVLSNLQPFKEYLILIRAATVAGWGPPASARHWTLSAPPSGGPSAVFIKRLGHTALEVTWTPPEVEKRNGVIVSYRLCAKEVGDSSTCHNVVIVGGSDYRLAIAGLKPYTWYAVSAEAGTTGGYGPHTVFQQMTGEWVPSGTPAEISVPVVNDSSITVSWKSPNENEINGILTSYKIEIYEQLDSGYLEMISNRTVGSAVSSCTFGGLKLKTEYIVEVKAGTVMGFGPPSVVHQKTFGEADVTYVKKSNKAYLALAKAGIAAGALSFLAVIGFIIFVSLLVTGYVPYTSPWRKRRRNLWRKKIEKQKEERERWESDSEESDFNSSNSNSSRGSEFSEDGSDDSHAKKSSGRKKGNEKSSKKQRIKGDAKIEQDLYNDSSLESIDDLGNIKVPLPNPRDPTSEEIYGQALRLNAYVQSMMSVYCANVEDIYGTGVENPYGTRPQGNNLRPEDIYDTRPPVNNLAPENIYGTRPKGNNLRPEDIYGTRPPGNNLAPENIYGTRPQGNNLRPEDIYGTRPPGNNLRPEDIYGTQPVGVAPEGIHGPLVNTLSVHNYPGDVTSDNLYGTHYVF